MDHALLKIGGLYKAAYSIEAFNPEQGPNRPRMIVSNTPFILLAFEYKQLAPKEGAAYNYGVYFSTCLVGKATMEVISQNLTWINEVD